MELHQAIIRAEIYSRLLAVLYQTGREILGSQPSLAVKDFTTRPSKTPWQWEQRERQITSLHLWQLPKWMEIQAALFPGDHAQDRPDILWRVFKIKLDAYFRKTRHLYTNYWIAKEKKNAKIKRGFLHAHVLLTMTNRHKPSVPEFIDKVSNAEIFVKHWHPELFNSAMAHNIHGPCGAINTRSPCMETRRDGAQCTQDFRKPFQ